MSHDRIHDGSAQLCGSTVNFRQFVLFSINISYHKSILCHNSNVVRAILLYPEYRLRRYCVFTMYPLSLRGSLTGRSPLSTPVNGASAIPYELALMSRGKPSFSRNSILRHTILPDKSEDFGIHTQLYKFIFQITLIFYRYEGPFITII